MALASTQILANGLAQNLGADRILNGLKQMAGEVKGLYEKAHPMVNLVTLMNMPAGQKTAQFILRGRGTVAYFTPGDDLNRDAALASGEALARVPFAEKLIHVDKPLISGQFIANMDEFISHYSLRAPIMTAMTEELLYKEDGLLLRMAIIGAAQAADSIVTGQPRGIWFGTALPSAAVPGGAGSVSSATFDGGGATTNFETDPSITLAGIASVQRAFDENFIPATDRYMIVRPLAFYNLLKNPEATNYINPLNRDYGSSASGFSMPGESVDILGMRVIKHPNASAVFGVAAGLSTTTHQYGTGSVNDYRVTTAVNVRAVAFHRSALGVARQEGIKVEADPYLASLQGQMLAVKLKESFGWLRPEALAVIAVA